MKTSKIIVSIIYNLLMDSINLIIKIVLGIKQKIIHMWYDDSSLEDSRRKLISILGLPIIACIIIRNSESMFTAMCATIFIWVLWFNVLFIMTKIFVHIVLPLCKAIGRYVKKTADGYKSVPLWKAKDE